MDANGAAGKGDVFPNQGSSWGEGRLTSFIESLPVWRRMALSLLAVVLIGWADWGTGWEFSFFVFYAFPISFAAWWVGPSAAFIVSLACASAWAFAVAGDSPYQTEWGMIWGIITRLFYFGIVCVGVAAVRNRQESDAARIRTLEERRQLERDIVAVSEHEQQRIGQDLHDGLCQQLAAIGCALRALAEDLRSLRVPAADDAELIEASIHRATAEARNLARGIFPVHVDRDGLAVALGDLARTMGQLTGVDIQIREAGDHRVDDPEKAMHIYRIAQEAVANAVRHGQAGRIWISLEESDGTLELRVEDDGRGIDAEAAFRGKGMGMRTMHYRAHSLGDCRLTIQPRQEGGTVVRCLIHPSGNTNARTEYEIAT